MHQKIMILLSAIIFFIFSSPVYGQNRPKPLSPQPSINDEFDGEDQTPNTSSSTTTPPSTASSYNYSLGYESSTTGIMAQNYIVGGKWFSPSFGLDIFFGYTKSADTTTTASSTTTNVTAKTKSITTTYSGSTNPNIFTLAAYPKWKLFRNRWLLVYGGAFAGVNYFTKTEYPSAGNIVDSTPNTDAPTTRNVTETNIGTTTVEPIFNIVAGPRISAELFLKWFPQIAVGMSTGMATTLGGNTVTKTNRRSRTYAITNGAEQTPSADSNDNVETTLKPGMSASTFGLGGTQFNLFGNFTIRYYW